MIYVYVRGRDASAQTTEPLTTGSVGVPVRFAFSEDWDDLAKTSIWKGSGTTVDILLTEDECSVPPEVLAESGGKLRVGVYGTDGETIVQPTVWAEVETIQKGAEPSGVEPDSQTPTLIEQLLAALIEKGSVSVTFPTKTSQLQNDSGFLTQHQDISGKLDKAQGAANAGKFMVVGTDGDITAVTMAAWQEGSY